MGIQADKNDDIPSANHTHLAGKCHVQIGTSTNNASSSQCWSIPVLKLSRWAHRKRLRNESFEMMFGFLLSCLITQFLRGLCQNSPAHWGTSGCPRSLPARRSISVIFYLCCSTSFNHPVIKRCAKEVLEGILNPSAASLSARAARR